MISSSDLLAADLEQLSRKNTAAVTFKICQDLSAMFLHQNNSLALVLRVCEILTFISEQESYI